MEIRETETFRKWFSGLGDDQAKRRIDIRIKRLAIGNPGDVAPVGEGVSEMRISYGPGYRVYFKNTVTIQPPAGDSGNRRNEGAFSPEMSRLGAKGGGSPLC